MVQTSIEENYCEEAIAHQYVNLSNNKLLKLMFCVEESCGINETANPVSPAAVAHSRFLWLAIRERAGMHKQY